MPARAAFMVTSSGKEKGLFHKFCAPISIDPRSRQPFSVLAVCCAVLLHCAPLFADTLTLQAAKDNTMYSSNNNSSNGAGDYIFSGNNQGGSRRRALIAFDIDGSIPQGSVINNVTLTLVMNQTQAGSQLTSLHRVLADWGEAGSHAPGEEGGGGAAATGDATWLYRFFATTTWATLGGDFDPSSSAAVAVADVGPYSWSSAGMVSDVQDWLDNPATDFGWIIIGNELVSPSAKRFISRQNGSVILRPALEVNFTPPVVEGACCLGNGQCELLSPGVCSIQGGTYVGNDTSCKPDTCPEAGACCLNTGICVDVIETLCDAQVGSFHGTGTACDSTDCIGACCFASGVCKETTLGDCDLQSGTYQGLDSACDPNPCVQPEGACCFGDGGCTVLTLGACGALDGAYQGNDTNCTPNPCAQPGACCFDTGACSFVLQTECIESGATFQGKATTCTPNECPQPGACCFDSGACSSEFASSCLDAGGTFTGEGTGCSPNTCPQPGACCIDSGMCSIEFEPDCAIAGGTYQGQNSTCDPGQCPVILEPFVDALPIPAVLQPVSGVSGGEAHYEIAMTEFTQQLHRDLPPTTVWGYAGSFPGPTIEAARDQTVTVNWINDLRDEFGIPRKEHYLAVDTCLHGPNSEGPNARTVVHLHGAHVGEESDGYPDYTFVPGGSALYRYPNGQLPATLWYHDHAMGITRLNVYMGLAGFYLIRDEFEQNLNLPSGEFEIPLVIQDRTFNPDGSLEYPDVWQDHFFGDTILVNGKVWPVLQVKRGKYRFRILNGSNSRFLRLSLSTGTPFIQIGTDGGLLPEPLQVSELLLAPAERADVIIDFLPLITGTEVILTNDAPAPFPGTPGSGVVSNIMRFDVLGIAGHVANLPAALRPMEVLQEESAVQVREFELRKDPLSSPPCAATWWLVNGLRWVDITEFPELGTTEVWSFVNRSGLTHPMHMHLVMFQILDRQPFEVVEDKIVPIGDPIPPEAFEAGWKDTVRTKPQMITRVIARFEDFSGKFPYHCHILEHEDHEMMRQFQTVCTSDENCNDGDFCTKGVCEGGDCTFPPRDWGDVNRDGATNIVDVVCSARVTFQDATICNAVLMDESDVDLAPPATCGDGVLNIIDVVTTARAVFQDTSDECCGE